jgi:hypothetical protein
VTFGPDDDLFSFPAGRRFWQVTVTRRSVPGEQGAWQQRVAVVEANDAAEAALEAAKVFPGWDAVSVANKADLARAHLIWLLGSL